MGDGGWMMSEERGIAQHLVDATLRDVEILLVGLEAYEVALLHQCRHSRRAAANRRVEDGVALVGVGQDKVAQEVNGLLGGVK